MYISVEEILRGGIIAKIITQRLSGHFWPLVFHEKYTNDEKGDFTVIKKCENAKIIDLPFIEVNLYRNGEVFKTIELDGSEDWTYTWIDLEKYDENGKEYIYTVDEVSVPEGFEKSVEGNVITNRYTRNVDNLPATGVSNISLYSSFSMIVGGLYILFKKD